MNWLYSIFIACILIVPSTLHAQTPTERFTQANALYANEKYFDALRAYEDLSQEGYISAALYYNAGNACYKLEKIGRARVFYEKALRLQPRNEDVRHNLVLISKAVAEPEPLWWETLLDFCTGWINLNEWAVLFLISFISTMLLLTAIILMRYPMLYLFATLALLTSALSGSALGYVYYTQLHTTSAIVISGPAEVRNGPGSSNSVGFSLSEGRKVEIIGHKQDWYAIGIPAEGLKGWLQKKYLEKI